MIIFQNPGLIDLNAVETLGVSVKPKTSTPFGQFGTGLKYAIAVILRESGSFSIYRGKECHIYTSVRETIREKEFQVVYRDGNRLSFTTEFGKNWKPWQAFRELWANCMDEGGKVWHLDTDDPNQWYQDGRPVNEQMHMPDDATTIVWVGTAAEEAWNERETVLLRSEPIAKLQNVEIHEGPSQYIYYNGIRVYEFPSEKKTAYTYNLTSWQFLTEERLLAYWFAVPPEIVADIMQCTDEKIIETVLTARRMENEFPWTEPSKEAQPGEVFVRTSMRLHRENKLSGNAEKLYRKFFESYARYGYEDPRVIELGPAESVVVHEAVHLLVSKGVVFGGFKFRFMEKMEDAHNYQIDRWRSTIYINSAIIPHGVIPLAQAMFHAVAYVASFALKEADYSERHASDPLSYQMTHFLFNGSFDNWPPEKEEEEAA